MRRSPGFFLAVVGLTLAGLCFIEGRPAAVAHAPWSDTDPSPNPIDTMTTPAEGALQQAVRTGPSRPNGERFVQRIGSSLVVEGRPWSFAGLNIYNANSRSTCWYPMTTADLHNAFSASGAKVMRAWFFQSELLTPGRGGAWDWRPFDETISAARSSGVRIIATLADHWGACEPGGEKDLDWYRTGYRTDRPAQLDDQTMTMPATYRDYVAAIVARYRDEPTIMGWQLVNEPETSERGRCTHDAPAVLQHFATDVASMVRSIDANHLVSMGTIGSGQCGTSGAEYADLQEAGDFDWCELHDYYGVAISGGDERNGMETRLAQCADLGLPVIIGEAGIELDAVSDRNERADAFSAKIAHARQRGVDGYLIWSWADPPIDWAGSDQFAIGPGDPALHVLAETARGWNLPAAG